MSTTLPLEVYLLTFNCSRELVDPRTLSTKLFSAWPRTKRSLPDVISVSLQEVAPLNEAFRGPSHVEPYIQQVAKTIDVATTNYATGSERAGYKLLKWHGAGLTAQILFVRPELLERVRGVLVAEVGCGVWSMGNKGAAGIRLLLSSSHSPSESGSDTVCLTFVAAHLYPHEGGCAKRNENWNYIVSNLVFESEKQDHHLTFVEERDPDSEPLLSPPPKPNSNSNSNDEYATHMFSPAGGYLFFAGDLNYRTSDKGPEDKDHASFPQANAPEDSPHHYTNLLAQDQLNRERAANRTLHNLHEVPIHFPPTYKYAQPKADADLSRRQRDPRQGEADGQEEVWNFSQHRFPSWCDRILFARPENSTIETHQYTCLPVQATSDHRPVALSVTLGTPSDESLNIKSPAESKPLFPVNPNYRADRNTAIVYEVVVGYATFFAVTRQGNSIVAATIGAIIATILVLRALV